MGVGHDETSDAADLLKALALLIGVACLSAAMAIRWGTLPLELIAAALLLLMVGTIFPRGKPTRLLAGVTERTLMVAVVGALALQIGWLATDMPLLGSSANLPTLANCGYGWSACGACAIAAVASPSKSRGFLLAALGLSAVMCVAIVLLNPAPPIDVELLHQGAFEALRAGHSPYGGSITNLYPGSHFYAPEVLSHDRTRVLLGYPYPPIQVLLAFAANVVFGNYRLFHALAFPLSAALVAFARPGKPATAAAMVLALLPGNFFVLAGSWTEPVLLLLFSLALFAALRAPRFLPYALGLFFADKQYAVLLFPLALLLFPRGTPVKQLVRAALIVGAVGLAVTLPLALWNPPGFMRDVLLFQLRQPFRPDSLSLSALLFEMTRKIAPSWLPFAALGLGLGLSLWRAPRTPQGFAAACALCLALFFGFAKQSFENYLVFISGCALWALALSGAGADANATAIATNAQLVTQGT